MFSSEFEKNLVIPIEPLIKIAETAKLQNEESIKKYIMAVGLSNDKRMAHDFITCVQPKLIYELLEKYPYSIPSKENLYPNSLNGRLHLLGKIKRSRLPFIYPTDLWNQHGLILGGTGTGKTNVLYGIALQAMKQGIPIWIIDKDKTDYRHLRNFFPDLLVFDAQENFIFNPLEVPKFVKPKHWIATFVTVFAKSTSLLEGSESLLIRAMYELYEKFGIFKGHDTFPTFIDLYEKIVSYNFRGNSRGAGYQDSLINRLGAYIATNQKMYEYSKGFPIEELAKRSFVLEVKGLTERIARFTINIPLYALFLHRIGYGLRGNAIRTLILVDESKWLANPGFNENLSFSPLTYILAQGREVGIGLIMADQSAELDDAAFVNSRIKFCFRLGSGKDIEKVRQTMALTKEQADYITKLDTGECIVRIPQVEPFVLQTLKVKLE